MTLESRLRRLLATGDLDIPLPGQGATATRHRRLATIARTDLALARLAEAHVDAIAILAEAGRRPNQGIYGVWAAETAHLPVYLDHFAEGLFVTGTKMFCTGAGLIDRALITVDECLVDVNLRDFSDAITIDQSAWKSSAFAETNTAAVTFRAMPVAKSDVVGERNWYLKRPGFWHGACGPAACWAGGAMGLYDYAILQSRDDCHTVAHLAAIKADVWALWAYLDQAGMEIDNNPSDVDEALVRALTVRHLIEQAASDILLRVGRAYGPRPLAYDSQVSQRYQEVELYIRQSHAERDLEVLGRKIKAAALTPQPA